MKNILVVVAHLGDEILGCGGTIALASESGCKVRVLVLGDGWTSRVKNQEKGLEALDLNILESQGKESLALLGINDVKYFRLSDNRFDSIPNLDIVKIIEKEKSDFNPNTVYTNSVFDLNVDQRITCQAVLTAFRPFPNDKLSKIYSMEIPSSTEWYHAGDGRSFVPNTYIDITKSLAKKIKAFSYLKTEQRQWPHARSSESIEHQSRYRGSSVGLEAAEAFVLLRDIVR